MSKFNFKSIRLPTWAQYLLYAILAALIVWLIIWWDKNKGWFGIGSVYQSMGVPGTSQGVLKNGALVTLSSTAFNDGSGTGYVNYINGQPLQFNFGNTLDCVIFGTYKIYGPGSSTIWSQSSDGVTWTHTKDGGTTFSSGIQTW